MDLAILALIYIFGYVIFKDIAAQEQLHLHFPTL
jgi:hypothetical protein